MSSSKVFNIVTRGLQEIAQGPEYVGLVARDNRLTFHREGTFYQTGCPRSEAKVSACEVYLSAWPIYLCRKSLYKLSFKRVRKALAAFRSLSEMVSPERREKLKNKYTARGAFEFSDQTAHIGSSRPVVSQLTSLRRTFVAPSVLTFV